MKLYVIQRADTGEVFAGFQASHRPSNPRVRWETLNVKGEPILIYLYAEKDELSMTEVCYVTAASCAWVSISELLKE